jgi:hypothetical protein
MALVLVQLDEDITLFVIVRVDDGLECLKVHGLPSSQLAMGLEFQGFSSYTSSIGLIDYLEVQRPVEVSTDTSQEQEFS